MSYRRTVSPPIMFAPQIVPAAHPKGKLIVVNWNVHVGHGDVAGLIDRISSHEEANGFGKPEFVLLLQETFRQSEGIPAPSGFKVPGRIAPLDPNMARKQ